MGLYQPKLDEFKETIQRNVRIAACKAKFIEVFKQTAQYNGFTLTDKDLGKVFHRSLLMMEDYDYKRIKKQYAGLSEDEQVRLTERLKALVKRTKLSLTQSGEEDKISPAKKIEDFKKAYLKNIVNYIEERAQGFDVSLSEAAEAFKLVAKIWVNSWKRISLKRMKMVS